MLIHLIGDYGHGDLAFSEVEQRLAAALPGAKVVPLPVPAFDTVSGGFCAAQLALTDGPADRVVYHNVAPRQDASDPRPANEGERLVLAELESGVLVVGPNAGHSFSFVRDEAASLRYVDVPAAGSQFRSRDIFPEAIAGLALGERGLLGAEVAREAVPPPPERAVVYVDGYGNLKTSWEEPPAGGSRLRVTIGAAAAEAVVADGTFEVSEGEISFAPGSAGWTTRRGGRRRFCELLLRGGSAAERFGRPRAGTEVELEVIEGG